MKRVTLLGATGSIGLRTLEIVSAFPEELSVAGMAARGSNPEAIADLCRKYAPAAVALLEPKAVDALARLLPPPRPELLSGMILQVGDKKVDASLSRKLRKLFEALMERGSQEVLRADQYVA